MVIVSGENSSGCDLGVGKGYLQLVYESWTSAAANPNKLGHAGARRKF